MWYIKYFIWCHFLFSVACVLMENTVPFASLVMFGLSPAKHSPSANNFKYTLVLYSRTGACQIGALRIRDVIILVHVWVLLVLQEGVWDSAVLG